VGSGKWKTDRWVENDGNEGNDGNDGNDGNLNKSSELLFTNFKIIKMYIKFWLFLYPFFEKIIKVG